MSTAISYPFTLDSVGVVEPTEVVTKIYLDRVLTLLSTNIGQRPMLQDYGTNVMRALFENDNDFPAAVDQAIRQAVGIWIPEISINQITISPPGEDGTATVDIVIELPNSLLTSLSINTAIFNIDGTITATE